MNQILIPGLDHSLTVDREWKPTEVYTYQPGFLTTTEADELYDRCLALPWQQNTFRMYGKEMSLPRLEVMCGDRDASYVYSGRVYLRAIPWPDFLYNLKRRIEAQTGYTYQIVIGNQYRDGKDSIGWHSDSEPTLGQFPAIASVSLGATRKFQIRLNEKKSPITSLELEHGSLLLMEAGCQETYIHQVPKTTKPVGDRINLTFRPYVGGVT